MEKENNSDESDFSKNEIPDLNSLKPFKFEPKTNIENVISSSSDDEDEGVEYKVKQWVVRVQRKSSRWQMLFKIGVRPATLLKRDSSTGAVRPATLLKRDSSAGAFL